jgi:hypothetical protein
VQLDPAGCIDKVQGARMTITGEKHHTPVRGSSQWGRGVRWEGQVENVILPRSVYDFEISLLLLFVHLPRQSADVFESEKCGVNESPADREV